jgi:type IV pilus assembly protein PilC
VEFRCRLASPTGEIVEGVYVADTEARLRHELEEKGLYVLSLQPKHAIAGVSLSLPQRSGVNTREFLVFNQELATLLKAGMPLVQSLDLLKRRVTSPVFKRVLDDVHEKVRSGTALSDAFAAHGDLFPRVYTASLLAGERSGNLDAVLRRFVEYTKIIATVKRKTVSALVYPAILTGLAIVLVSIIVLKVVPAFADFYSSFGADLPVATRVILGISEIVRSQFLLILAVIVGRGRGRLRVGAAAGPEVAVRSPCCWGCRCSVRWRASSPPPRWRGRSPRCSAAACRWSTRWTSRPSQSAINSWRAARHRERARPRRRVVRGGARSAAGLS